MIEKINSFNDFLFIMADFTLDVNELFNNVLLNNNSYQCNFSSSTSFNLIKDYLPSTVENNQFAASKKILNQILLEIQRDINDERLNGNKALNFITSFDNELQISSYLFKKGIDVSHSLFSNFFDLYFNYFNLTSEEYVLKVEEFLMTLENLNIDLTTQFGQSILITLLRGLQSRNALLINKILSKKIINLITPKGLEDSFIPSFFHRWTQEQRS